MQGKITIYGFSFNKSMSQDLCEAVRNQDIDMVIALLDRGDNVNYKSETSSTKPAPTTPQ